MKAQDCLILVASGLVVWILGTVYYTYRGATMLESGNLRYWAGLCLSAIASAALCIGILRWRQTPAATWASAMLLLALPGMIGEAIVLSHFPFFMPRLQQNSAGRYGALLFAAYAVALGIAEVITLRATP